MADVDILVASSASLGSARNSLTGIIPYWVTPSGDIVFGYYSSNLTPYRQYMLARSTDDGDSFSTSEIGAPTNFASTGINNPLLMDTAGKLYYIGNDRDGSSNRKLYLFHDRSGSWSSSIEIADIGAFDFRHVVAYYEKVDSLHCKIHIGYGWLDGSSVGQMRHAIWESNGGGITTINMNTGPFTSSGAGNPYMSTTDGYGGSMVPHPSTYGPIYATVHYQGTNPFYSIHLHYRKPDGSWVYFGSFNDGTDNPVYYPHLYPRRAALGSYWLDIYYMSPGAGNWNRGPYLRRHTLNETGPDTPSAKIDSNRLDTPSWFYAPGWYEVGTGVPSESSDLGVIQSVINNPQAVPHGFYQYAPDIAPPYPLTYTSQWTSPAGNSPRGVGCSWYPGVDGLTIIPSQRLQAGFAFPYQYSTSSVRWFKKDGTTFGAWSSAYPVYVPTITFALSVISGVTTLISGTELSYGDQFFAHANNLQAPLYQKVQIRNDLSGTKRVRIHMMSSKGSIAIAPGTQTDTHADARGYSYGNSLTWDIPDTGHPANSRWFWARWTPPAGYGSSPVGTVLHWLYRDLM